MFVTNSAKLKQYRYKKCYSKQLRKHSVCCAENCVNSI